MGAIEGGSVKETTDHAWAADAVDHASDYSDLSYPDSSGSGILGPDDGLADTGGVHDPGAGAGHLGTY
jgi:hypothetical protein